MGIIIAFVILGVIIVGIVSGGHLQPVGYAEVQCR